jgi:hypothetical protein
VTERRARAALAAGVIALVAAASRGAHAGPPEPPSDGALTLTASPVLGQDAASGNGWMEIALRIDNGGAQPRKGTVELETSALWGSGDMEPTARAPFNVAAGRSAIVKLPTHGFAYYTPQMTVTAFGENGAKLATATVNANGSSSPLLVDVDQPSRLGIALRGWAIPATWNPGSTGSGYASSALTVGAPTFDRTTGDPILPDRAAGYAAVTVLLIHSETLVGLEQAKLDALIGWVIGGGTLAVIPSRPEDLRGALLGSLTGGAVSTTAPAPMWFKLPVNERPSNAPQIGAPSTEDPPEETQPDPSPPGGPIQLTPPKTPRALRYGPSAAVREHLVGYSGGNLRTSAFGASTPYGAGEVHLLAFDPTATRELEDAWVHSRIVDMLARAWDRRAVTAFPHGSGEHGVGRMDDVRRALDPNENFRLGLGLSAILLVVYSIVVGPLTFLRAAKTGKPLSPLKWAPIWSAAAFALIVIVGLAGKGWRGRARHLSLIEVSGGFARGTVRQYRGFFASETRSLTVTGSDRMSTLEVAPTEGSKVDYGVLALDRNGMALGDLTSLPWQTVVVREDGFADVKGGFAIVPMPEAGHRLINRTGRALDDVVVSLPKEPLRYFASIADGQSVDAADGRVLSAVGLSRTGVAGTMTVHPLAASEIRALLGGKSGERFGSAWEPLEAAAGDAIDWWPDVPVVLAEVHDPPKPAKDSGLGVESERVLVRIVGVGGLP